ncbi:hypothetical protein MKX67_19980 [Cytobacillus sp. FSL W7-1323]|uniref:DUF5683 domain-containing protein n=1 Tax=Cytobacillus kochii TaxID=859143 RepID=A0A248TJF3_9BACI|nr:MULTISPECIES: hypothetical protein [Cytobacillus]ASV68333.1 hypothetical protein CKF48_13960 [Cytobacillus kochii]MDQ0186957.1 hypothetical protein [Cytobacillus kochii]MEA1855431.1 hypothetical protein [Cytobacillus sp. OWB-43]MED1605516.1 hypothetical protein [Cytobacillus kochii]
MRKNNPIEKLFWSIAFPGFGQYLNGKLFKGTVFLVLEILFNVMGNFNEIIMLSFQGKVHQAAEAANYGWLMFYPCLYFFAIWDAYKDAGGEGSKYSFLPFVFCAYFVTVGLMYSTEVSIFGVFFGPVWLPMIAVIPGVIIGWLIRFVIIKFSTSS